MKPRTGLLFKRWRGKYFPADSKLSAPYYLAYQTEYERKVVALKTHDREEAERRAAEHMAGIRYGSREQWLTSMIRLGENARRELHGAHIEENPIAIDGAWKKYEASRRRPSSGPATMQTYRSHWNGFAKWLPATTKRMNEVSPALAEQFVRYIEKPAEVVVGRGKHKRKILRARNPETVDKAVSFLRLMWRTLLPKVENPWTGLHSAMDHTATPHRALDVSEVRKVVESVDGDWRDLLIIGYTTGLRLKDCCLLDWSAVDLDALTIKIVPAKTSRKRKRPLCVPIVPDLAVTLRARKAFPRGPVLPEVAAAYAKDRTAVSKQMRKTFINAKVMDSGDGTASFHSLRATWQTLNDIAGTSRVITRSVLGHSSPSMSDTYSRMDVDTARRAVEKALPRVLAS